MYFVCFALFFFLYLWENSTFWVTAGRMAECCIEISHAFDFQIHCLYTLCILYRYMHTYKTPYDLNSVDPVNNASPFNVHNLRTITAKTILFVILKLIESIYTEINIFCSFRNSVLWIQCFFFRNNANYFSMHPRCKKHLSTVKWVTHRGQDSLASCVKVFWLSSPKIQWVRTPWRP